MQRKIAKIYSRIEATNNTFLLIKQKAKKIKKKNWKDYDNIATKFKYCTHWRIYYGNNIN